jgi:protocatechuate 3,4-dioxygenase beta subunit
MKLWQRISTVVLAALLSLAALMGLIGVGRAQDAPTAPDITASISGVVRSATGQPLADIEVTALRSDSHGRWSTTRTTRTDASGAYKLDFLNTGIYRLGFWDMYRDFLPAYFPNAANVESALDIPVASVDVTGLEAVLRPALHIAGVVTDDSGQPLLGISVSVYRHDPYYDEWELQGTVQTDASGAYTVSRLYPATYRLGFQDPGEQFVAQFYPDAQSLGSAQDIPITDANVTGLQTTLQRSAQIAGVVTMWDESQLTSAYIKVYAQTNGEWSVVKSEYLYSYSNDPARHYRITGLLPGRYRIGVNGSYWNGSTFKYYEEFYDDEVDIQEADDILLGGGDIVTDVNFVLGDNPHLANLSGVVTSPEGVGLLEVVVTAHISDTWGWQEIHQTRTITDGVYTLRALPVGEYAIRFHDPQHRFTTEYYDNASEIDAATIISITRGGEHTGIDAELAPTGNIIATVTMYDGQTPQYAEVKAYSATSNYSDMVASQSVYPGSGQPVTITLSGLFPDEYRLYVTARDANNTYSEYFDDALLIENATDVTVLSGGVTEVHAVLGENPGYARIMGTVRSRESMPLANIEVTAYYPEYPGAHSWTPRQSTLTDQSGNYALWALAPNTYIVEFEDPEGAYVLRYYDNATDRQSATQIQLEAQQTVIGIDAVLPQTGMLTGTVTLYDGHAPVSGDVTLYRYYDSEFGGRGEIVRSQSLTPIYRFTQLPTGYYRVGVSASFGNDVSYRQKYYPDAVDISFAEDVYVEDGMTTSNINFVFGEDEHDARIEGEVYADGTTLPGMQIDLYAEDGYDSWWRLVYVRTDAAGAFRIDGLQAGKYRICVVDPAQVRESVCYPGAGDVEGASAIELADGQVVNDLRIEMKRFAHRFYLPVIAR